jgi:hypothetical protein
MIFEIQACAYLPFASFSTASFDLDMYLDVQTFLAYCLDRPSWVQVGIEMRRQLGAFLHQAQLQMIRRTRWGQVEVVMMALFVHLPVI